MGTQIIRITGDKVLTRALKILAIERGCDMADLVREAVDSHLGDTLRDAQAYLIAQDVQRITRSNTELNTQPGDAQE